MRRLVWLMILAGALTADPGPAQEAAAPFALRDGERVVLIGSGLIEHDQFHGYLEARLTRHDPKAHAIFRNLGWGGDNVRGGARTSGFENPEGLARLLKEAGDLKPTVIFLGYGMNESFDGPDGLPGFVRDYGKLLDQLGRFKARLVLLTPTYHEDLGRPLPDPAAHNRHLEQYAAAVRRLGQERGLPVVDLFQALAGAEREQPKRRLTTNGIQLNAAGYALAAQAIERQLGYPARTWRVALDQTGKVTASEGCRVDKIEAGPAGVRFEVVDGVVGVDGDVQLLRVAGLASGEYVLKIAGQTAARATNAAWEKGVEFSAAAVPAADKLRQAIVRKGELNYRRWRPFNDHSRHWTFIGGDFALYDRQIAAQEKAIASLRAPRPQVYDITLDKAN